MLVVVLLHHHPPPTLKTSKHTRFRGWLLVSSLTTNLENEQTRSFLMFVVVLLHHHPPPTLNTSKCARFRGWLLISSIITHHPPRKRAHLLVFDVGCWFPAPATTNWSFSRLVFSITIHQPRKQAVVFSVFYFLFNVFN